MSDSASLKELYRSSATILLRSFTVKQGIVPRPLYTLLNYNNNNNNVYPCFQNEALIIFVTSRHSTTGIQTTHLAWWTVWRCRTLDQLHSSLPITWPEHASCSVQFWGSWNRHYMWCISQVLCVGPFQDVPYTVCGSALRPRGSTGVRWWDSRGQNSGPCSNNIKSDNFKLMLQQHKDKSKEWGLWIKGKKDCEFKSSVLPSFLIMQWHLGFWEHIFKLSNELTWWIFLTQLNNKFYKCHSAGDSRIHFQKICRNICSGSWEDALCYWCSQKSKQLKICREKKKEAAGKQPPIQYKEGRLTCLVLSETGLIAVTTTFCPRCFKSIRIKIPIAEVQ